MKVCTHCGETFEPKFPTAKLCYSCWLLREAMLEEYPELEREVRTLRLALERKAPPAIPPDILKILIGCCHPDKHGNSKSSNTATRWLLEQRTSATQFKETSPW